jgi:hypothetical protein
VLTAVGKPRSVRPRGRSVLSELFYPVFVLLRFVHSIVLLFSAPLLLHFPFTPAVLLFTLLGEGTQPSCCRYGIQKIEKENERVEVRALVCSQQLLEENQTHERQPVSTNPSEALHSDQEKRCGEKDSLSFPSRPGLKLREDISAETLHHLSVAPSFGQTLLPHTTTEPETRLQSRIAIRTGTFGLTWRTAASVANLGPTQASLESIG